MCDDYEAEDVASAKPTLRWRLGRAIGRWLGVKGGLTIVVPEGTTLTLEGAITVETVNVVGGTVNMSTQPTVVHGAEV